MTRPISIAYMVIGAALMIIVVVSPLRYRNNEEKSDAETVLLTGNSVFIIATPLSKARRQEARTLSESAKKLADGHAIEAPRASRWSYYLQWASFFLSSLIVVLAGYYGR